MFNQQRILQWRVGGITILSIVLSSSAFAGIENPFTNDLHIIGGGSTLDEGASGEKDPSPTDSDPIGHSNQDIVRGGGGGPDPHSNQDKEIDPIDNLDPPWNPALPGDPFNPDISLDNLFQSLILQSPSVEDVLGSLHTGLLSEKTASDLTGQLGDVQHSVIGNANHFYDNGGSLPLKYSVVPTPGPLLLLGLGTMLIHTRRKRS